jgi:hypothetical protein
MPEHVAALLRSKTFLSKVDVMQVFEVCDKTLARYIKDGLAPAPLPGTGRPRWLAAAVAAHLDRLGRPA